MIRFVRSLLPISFAIDANAEWTDVRDRLRRFADETRRALLALPRWQERTIAYDPADGNVTIAVDMKPLLVLVAYAVAQGTAVATTTTSISWAPGPDARSVVLSAVGGLSSGTRYDLRLVVMGED